MLLSDFATEDELAQLSEDEFFFLTAKYGTMLEEANKFVNDSTTTDKEKIDNVRAILESANEFTNDYLILHGIRKFLPQCSLN